MDVNVLLNKSLFITGKSGTGKTVLLKSMMALLTKDTSIVFIDPKGTLNVKGPNITYMGRKEAWNSAYDELKAEYERRKEQHQVTPSRYLFIAEAIDVFDQEHQGLLDLLSIKDKDAYGIHVVMATQNEASIPVEVVRAFKCRVECHCDEGRWSWEIQ